MSKDYEFIERIGIDKTIIGNIKIVSIDFDKLNKKIEKGRVTLHAESSREAFYILDSGEMFSYLKIIDNKVFSDFIAGVKICKGAKKEYAKISLTIRNNLQNKTCAEYKDFLKEVFLYLENEYGIFVDYSKVKFCEIEINLTFNLKNGSFKDYRRTLLMMIRNAPRDRYARKSNIKNKKSNITYCTFYEADKQLQEDKLQTLYVGNKEIELKIYDKGKQLANKLGTNMPSNLARIEYTLKTERKIRNALKTTNVRDIYDKQIKDYFLVQFNEDVTKQLKKWRINNRKKLKKLVTKHFNTNDKRGWISNMFREIRTYESIKSVPLLFDVNDLEPIIKGITKSHVRTISSIQSEAFKHEIDLMVIMKNWRKLLTKY
ncbi:hypothetical protein [Clostridium sp. Marseille-P299]|uniref:hypothetical protein n=1 Tax=Clostridium sp. Marseille-P299 TaxID=1805477 RepID=UPI00083718BB|nr:hypothetical protein [Clostridium sp. Marseille-P299]